MIKIADKWLDYEIIATGDGMKLERWKDIVLLRPDPQVIWHSKFDMNEYRGLNAFYMRSSTGGGYWEYNKKEVGDFFVHYEGMRFSLKLMGFKHTGLFPEQAVNWDIMSNLIKKEKRPIRVLNLFGYTGGATVACTKAGAEVCHVDAAKGMVDRCKDNLRLSGLADRPVRYIIDDCVKFVQKEIKRGKRYDAVIMDPPSYGRGPSGEIWKMESNIADFVALTAQVLSDDPLFFLINSYTTGLQPAVLSNILNVSLPAKALASGIVESYEVGLPTAEKGITLPCGASGLYYKKQ